MSSIAKLRIRTGLNCDLNDQSAYSHLSLLMRMATSQDVAEAIQRLPVHEQDLRLQRLKRATDCSLKKSYLPKDLQKVQTPFNFYIDVSSRKPCFLPHSEHQVQLLPNVQVHSA